MSASIEQLETGLEELRAERAGLVNARTKEDTAQAAAAFLETARARSQGLGALVVEGHAVGDPLDALLQAFVLADPRLEAWLVEQAGQFAELTEKERDSRVKKLDGEIAKVEKDLLAARKAEAIGKLEAEMAQVEADFAAAGEVA